MIIENRAEYAITAGMCMPEPVGTELSNRICYLATPLAILIFSNSMELETVDPLANVDVDDTADADTND